MTTTGTRSPSGRVRLSPGVGCLLIVALGLAGACLVVSALSLGARGEIVLAEGLGNESRVWLVRENEDAGLGWSLVRSAPSPEPGLTCERTTIGFLLWKASEPRPLLSYCECFRGTPSGTVLEGVCSR
jgi:hypothetical protein